MTKDKVRASATAKRWRTDNAERKKAKDKEWVQRNRDKVLATGRRYFKLHRDICAARSKRWRENNPDKVRAANHRNGVKRYGLTVQQYNEMLNAQGGGCAICGQKEKRGTRLPIDHVHATGKVRGLLCNNHNVAIGMLQDNVEVIKKLLLYIEMHQ